LDDHLQHRQQHGLFAALVPQEEVGGKGAIPYLGDAYLERTNTRGQAARTCSIPIAGPLVSAFVRFGLQVLGHLSLEHLVEQLLQEGRQLFVVAKEGLYLLAVHRTLDVGHDCSSGR
jgi:hypothetical protein